MLIHYTECVDINIYDLISCTKTNEPDITLEEFGDNLKYYIKYFLESTYHIESDDIDSDDIDAIWEELKEIWDA